MNKNAAMPRRLFWPLLAAVLIAALAGAAAAAITYRAPLLEAGLEIYLARHGYPEAKLTVADVAAERIVIESVSLGEGAPSAARITADSYLKLFQNEDRWRLEIESLRVPVDMTAAGGSGFGERLAALAEVLHEYRDWLPILDVKDALVTLHGRGGAALTLAGDVVSRVDWPSVGFAIKGRVEGEGTSADIDFRTGGSAELPGMRLDAEGQSDLAKLPWPEGLPVPAAGSAAFKIESLLPIPTLVESFADAFARFDGTAKLDLRLSGVSIPDRAEGVSAALTMEAEGNPDDIRLRLTEPAEISAAHLDLPELADAGPVGAALAGTLGGGARLTVTAEDAKTPVLALARVGGNWSEQIRARAALEAGKTAASAKFAGTVHGDSYLRPQELKSAAVELEGSRIPLGFATIETLAWKTSARAGSSAFELTGPLVMRLSQLPGLEQNGVEYSGAVKVSGSFADLAVEQQDAAKISLTGAPRFGAVSLDHPLKAAVISARTHRTADGIVIEVAARPEAFSGEIARDNAPSLPFAAAADGLRFNGVIAARAAGAFAFDNASLDLPAAEVSLEGITGTLPFVIGADAEPGQIKATIRSLADPVAFDAIEAALDVTRKKDSYELAGLLKLARGKAETPVTARYEPAAETGEMRIGPAEFVFKPGQLQPADLNPQLTAAGKAEGAMRFDGTFAYGPALGLTSGGQVVFEDLTLETAAVRIEKLSGVLDFLDLLKLRTAPDQVLTMAHVVAGTSLDDVKVDFSLATEDTGPVVAIDEASAHMADGELDVPETAVRVAADQNAATINVKSVSLARLLENLGTDNVTGTGELSGSIPVRFGRAGLAVDKGRLKALSEGVLHVRLGSAKATLEAQGEAMRLMVEALEDFHYTVLEFEIDRPVASDLSLKIKIEGNNPKVLDGHPFRFNISLTGNIEPLLAALKAGQGLTADILEKAVNVNR